MATINTSDIAGGDNDYPDLATWEAATDINLVGADTVEKAILFATETYDTANGQNFTGATTDSTRYREITAEAGDENDGTPNNGAGITQDTSGQHCARCDESFFRLSNIFLDGTGVSAQGVLVNADVQEVLVENCLIYDIPATRFAARMQFNGPTNVALRLRNVFISNCESGVVGDSGSEDKTVCEYVTIVRQETDADTATTGFRYVLCTDCAAFHFGPPSSHRDFLNLNGGSSNNASHDTSGSAGLQSLTAANEFVSITDDAMNLHLVVDSTLEEAATPIGGVTTDFDGDTRDVTNPDVGADEFVPVAAGVPTPYYYQHLLGV